MPKTIIKIKTWRCPSCDYSQDFEPTAELMAIHFTGVPADVCPACFMGENPTRTKAVVALPKETNPDKKTIMTVMGEEDIETEIEEAVRGERKDIDVSTEAKKNAYRTKRKADIAAAIIRAKQFEDI